MSMRAARKARRARGSARRMHAPPTTATRTSRSRRRAARSSSSGQSVGYRCAHEWEDGGGLECVARATEILRETGEHLAGHVGELPQQRAEHAGLRAPRPWSARCDDGRAPRLAVEQGELAEVGAGPDRPTTSSPSRARPPRLRGSRTARRLLHLPRSSACRPAARRSACVERWWPVPATCTGRTG